MTSTALARTVLARNGVLARTATPQRTAAPSLPVPVAVPEGGLAPTPVPATPCRGTAPSVAPSPQPSQDQRRARARRRAWGVRGAGLLVWASLALVVAIYLADRGTSGWGDAKDALKSAGILAGMVSADLMCVMLLLASRVPLLDRLVGHDRAIARHSSLGSWVVAGVAVHGVLLTWSYAGSAQTGIVDEFTQLWAFGDYALAVVSFGLLLAVGFSSALLALRTRLPHELWHAIHLTTYLAIALSIPHQFTMDSMFDSPWAKACWIALYALTAACLVAFRVVLPLVRSTRHQLRVGDVHPAGDGLVAVEVTGRHLERLGARGGQFLNWRFAAPGLALQAHPFSLSAAPDGRSLRLTVKVVGEGTRRIAALKPGTPVGIEGPYGRFTDDARTREAVVMLGCGSGIAPVRALLEQTATTPGRSLVVLRASSVAEVAHLDEFRILCRERGVQLVVLVGHRGVGWRPAGADDLTLVRLAPWIADADVYVCGPAGWASQVADEAGAYGVHPSQVHVENFTL